VTAIADEIIGIRKGQLLSGEEYHALKKEDPDDE
jgi:hypothetical protein